MEWRMKICNMPTIGLSWPPRYSTKNTASSHPNGAKWHRPQVSTNPRHDPHIPHHASRCKAWWPWGHLLELRPCFSPRIRDAFSHVYTERISRYSFDWQKLQASTFLWLGSPPSRLTCHRLTGASPLDQHGSRKQVSKDFWSLQGWEMKWKNSSQASDAPLSTRSNKWHCFKLSMLESPQLCRASWSNTSFFCLALPCKTHWVLEDSIGSCEVAPMRHGTTSRMKVTLSRRQFGIHPHLAEGMVSLGQEFGCVTWNVVSWCFLSLEIVCQVLNVNLFRVPWNTKGRQKAENNEVPDSLLIITWATCKHCAVLIGWEAELFTLLRFHRWDWVAGAFSVIFGEEYGRIWKNDISQRYLVHRARRKQFCFL